MLELVKRSPEYVKGYKDYCQEAFDNHITYFVPTNPARIDASWFERTKDWYDRKELGLISDQPIGFHYWAVDGDDFIGEFQLRTELTDEIMAGIGSIGYAVRVSRQGRGYGTEILKKGLAIAKNHGMNKVLLNINESNVASAHICEKLGGIQMDTISVFNNVEGEHAMRRYWIYL